MSGSSSYNEQKQLVHLKIPLEDIVSATDNFSDENFIGYDGFDKEYVGRLLRFGQLVDIVARRLGKKRGQQEKEFWREVSTLSRLEHKNIVSIIGFCDENGEKIVITKHESPRGTLYGKLSDRRLTWMQRLQICVGVGHALSYMYYDEGRDFSIIHRDINSSKILLDEKWEPKLSGFEASLTQAAAQRNHFCQPSDDYIWGRRAYIDPTSIETAIVSHKSDMFSLGVLLFELLCGRGEEEQVRGDEMYLYKSAISHYRQGRLYDLVSPGLWKQMGQESFKIFSETAYSCLNEQPSERPSIDQIVIQLEKALESQLEHENYVVRPSSVGNFRIMLELGDKVS